MDKININDFIGIIGTILGVIIGGLITLLVTHLQFKNQEKQRKTDRKIHIYEEIHKHLLNLDKAAGGTYISIHGKVSQNVQIEEKHIAKLPWQELEMMINFYTTELKNDFTIIYDKWEKLGEVFGLIILERYTRKRGPKDLLLEARELSFAISGQIDVMKNKLSELARKNA